MEKDSVYVPGTLNYSPEGAKRRMGGSCKRKRSMQPITYELLKAAMLQHLESADSRRTRQVFSNLNSALGNFLSDLGIPSDAVVGIELRKSFHKLRSRHLEAMQEAGREAQSIRDRKSLLGKWRDLLLTLDRIQAADSNAQPPFTQALLEAIPNGVSVKLLARQAGIPYATLKRWRLGVLPTARSLATVARLERYLALPPGQLTDLLGCGARAADKDTNNVMSVKTRAYRERLSALVAEHYRLHDVCEALRDQWREFVDYKTNMLTFGLKRGGRWKPSSLHPGPSAVQRKWYAFSSAGEYVPTAQINWTQTSGFLGWLVKYGGGVPGAEALAWLVDINVLNRYMDWWLKRTNGKVHTGHIGFVNFVLTLVHPKTGYLTQRSDLRFSLPSIVSEERWAEMCRTAFTELKGHQSTLKQDATKSRDPRDAIEQILRLEDPLLALKDMRHRMRADRPTPGTMVEAIWGRDLALVGLMMSTALRAKNLKHLTSLPDKKLHLRQRENGHWELFIPREEFKNADGAARNRDYLIELDPGIYRDLEAYIKYYRPVLLHGNTSATDLLFVTTEQGLKNLPWNSLNRRIEVLTRKYLMGCPGVGPHAIRHIVATAIIKRTGEFNTAALVLHDKEETVRKHYAHVLAEDGHVRYQKLFPDLFSN